MKKLSIESEYQEIINLRKFRIVMKMADHTNLEPQLLLFLLIMYKELISSNNSSSLYDFLNSDNNYKSVFFSSDIYLKTVDIASNLEIHVIENIQDFFTTIPNGLIENQFDKVFETILLEINNSHSYRRINEALPIEIIQLIKDLNIINDTDLIYNPFSGQSSFNTVFNENIFHNQEINDITREIANLRLNANQLEQSKQLENRDSISNWNPNNIKYNTIITAPPFGMRVRSEFDRIPESIESHVIKKGIESLTPDGKLILIIPAGFLTSHKDKKLKEWLINSNLLETIISLPGRTLNNTAISISILVINKKKNTDLVTLINGTECIKSNKENNLQGRSSYSALDNEKLINLIRENDPKISINITPERIKRDEYDLNPSRYFIDNIINDDLKRLDEISQLFRGERENDSDSILVKIGDLDNDSLGGNLNINSIKKGFIKGPVQRISESCLLLATIGHKLKPTWFKYEGTPISIRNGILPIKINTNEINIDYLVQELSSDNILKQLKYLSTGTTIPFYKKNDILGLRINIPTLEEQMDISLRNKENIIRAKAKELGLENRITELVNKHKDELRIKKHNIMQHLNGISSFMQVFHESMSNNNGVLDGKSKILENRDITINDDFKRLLKDIDKVSHMMSNITNDLKFGESTELNALDAIKKCKNKHPNYNIIIDFNEEDFNFDEYILSPSFKFSTDDFEELFVNIFENAKRHGDFNNTQEELEFIVLISREVKENIKHEKEHFILFSFQNNGIPLPKGMKDRFHIKGEKAGKNSNDGLGGWRIKEIAEHYDGFIAVNNDENEEFAVKINLYVPLIIDTNE